MRREQAALLLSRVCRLSSCGPGLRRAPRPQVIERVRQKAAMYGCDPAPALEDGIHPEADGEVWPACASYKVNPNLVAELYERWVMPLTKEVQVAYLLRRLDGVA